MWSLVSFEHVLMTHGIFIKLNAEFHFENVYAPCEAATKQVLWDFFFIYQVTIDGWEGVGVWGL